MNVTLKPELERFIEDEVNAGRFSSVADALEAGVARLMLDPPGNWLDGEDLAAIEVSEQQIARGEDVDWKEASATFRRRYLNG